jgi:hypothetical protein
MEQMQQGHRHQQQRMQLIREGKQCRLVRRGWIARRQQQGVVKVRQAVRRTLVSLGGSCSG